LFCWPGLAPAGDILSCSHKKGRKEGVLGSLNTRRKTRYAPYGRCAQTATASLTGSAMASLGGCGLMDALWSPRAASLAAQQAKRLSKKKRIHQGAATKTTNTASNLTRRGCLSAAPQARSEFHGAKLRSTPSLLTFLRVQESQSPAGARPGQQNKKPKENQKSTRHSASKNKHQTPIKKIPRISAVFQ